MNIIIILTFVVATIQCCTAQLVGQSIFCEGPDGTEEDISKSIPGDIDPMVSMCVACICKNHRVICEYSSSSCKKNPPVLVNQIASRFGETPQSTTTKTTVTTTTPPPPRTTTSPATESTSTMPTPTPTPTPKPTLFRGGWQRTIDPFLPTTEAPPLDDYLLDGPDETSEEMEEEASTTTRAPPTTTRAPRTTTKRPSRITSAPTTTAPTTTAPTTTTTTLHPTTTPTAESEHQPTFITSKSKLRLLDPQYSFRPQVEDLYGAIARSEATTEATVTFRMHNIQELGVTIVIFAAILLLALISVAVVVWTLQRLRASNKPSVEKSRRSTLKTSLDDVMFNV